MLNVKCMLILYTVMTVGLQSVKHVMNSGISIPKENITNQDNVLTEYLLYLIML